MAYFYENLLILLANIFWFLVFLFGMYSQQCEFENPCCKI